MPEEELVKVIFDGNMNQLGVGQIESMWAAIIRTQNGFVYELRNSPFYAKESAT